MVSSLILQKSKGKKESKVVKLNNFVFKLIDSSHLQLPSTITASIGKATDAKVQLVLEGYNKADHHLIGCFSVRKLIGVVGVQICDSKVIIKHISVLNEWRNQGVGKQLVQYVMRCFLLESIVVETDTESVGFYRALGFECNVLDGIYDRRYKCILSV